MASKTAPNIGESYLENGVRYLKVTFGDSGVADTPLANAIADSDTVVVTPVFSWGGGGMNLLGISTRVATAFKAGSAISIGTDSDASASAAAYWLSKDKVAATAAETYKLNTTWTSMDSGGSATDTVMVPLFYSASGTLELTYTPADSDELSTGVLEIGILYTYGA